MLVKQLDKDTDFFNELLHGGPAATLFFSHFFGLVVSSIFVKWLGNCLKLLWPSLTCEGIPGFITQSRSASSELSAPVAVNRGKQETLNSWKYTKKLRGQLSKLKYVKPVDPTKTIEPVLRSAATGRVPRWNQGLWDYLFQNSSLRQQFLGHTWVKQTISDSASSKLRLPTCWLFNLRCRKAGILSPKSTQKTRKSSWEVCVEIALTSKKLSWHDYKP